MKNYQRIREYFYQRIREYFELFIFDKPWRSNSHKRRSILVSKTQNHKPGTVYCFFNENYPFTTYRIFMIFILNLGML